MSFTKWFAKFATNYNSQQSLGAKLRAKRIVPFLHLVERVSHEHGHANIIDIGGTEQYWNILPKDFFRKNNVTVTIVNLPNMREPVNHGHFLFVAADACNLARFENNSFHIAHSNSVIEHVGDWNRMVQFSIEFKRVAQKHFIQTPNFWFPIEPHCMTPFFHWLPKPIRIWLVMQFSLGNWRKATSVDDAVRIVESARLLSKMMFRALFDDSEILTERIAFMSKSLIAIRE